jgi:hypothetical protein
MNPTLLFALLANNAADFKAIIEIIGIDNLIKLAPHFENILATVEKAQAK